VTLCSVSTPRAGCRGSWTGSPTRGETKRVSLILDRQVILDLGDPRRRPRGPFGNIPLVPGSNLAAENHPAAFCVDGDPGRLDLRAAPQGLLDLFFDIGGTKRRGDADLVDDVNDATELCTTCSASVL